MPRAHRVALPLSRRRWIAALLLAAALSACWLTAATASVGDFLRASESSPLVMPAAVILAACGLLQLRSTYGVFWNRAASNPVAHAQLEQLTDARYWLLVAWGVVLLYLAALAVGPVGGIGWAWLAAVAAWQTAVLLLPLAASPQVAESWRRWTENHRPRRLNWLVAAALLGIVTGEATLRATGALRDQVPGVPLKLTALAPAAINEQHQGPAEFGPFTLRYDRMPAARLRVALLGEAGSDATLRDLAYHVQQSMPSAEVMTLPVRWDAADLTSTRLAAAVQDARPDVVLTVLPACDEVVPARGVKSLFDWRQFELARLLHKPAEQAASEPSEPAADSFESFLAGLKPQLAACRTPLDARARSRWQRTCAALDRTIAGCGKAQVALAVVVVPAELQLNANLQRTLLRRSGLSSEQFDVDLPQRQLATFAEQRAVPVVDLLPALRLCSQPVYERNTTRLSEPGNRTAAAAIGGWLESRFGDRLAAQLSRTK